MSGYQCLSLTFKLADTMSAFYSWRRATDDYQDTAPTTVQSGIRETATGLRLYFAYVLIRP